MERIRSPPGKKASLEEILKEGFHQKSTKLGYLLTALMETGSMIHFFKAEYDLSKPLFIAGIAMGLTTFYHQYRIGRMTCSKQTY